MFQNLPMMFNQLLVMVGNFSLNVLSGTVAQELKFQQKLLMASPVLLTNSLNIKVMLLIKEFSNSSQELWELNRSEIRCFL